MLSKLLLLFLLITVIQASNVVNMSVEAGSEHTGSAYCKGRTCKFVSQVVDLDAASAVGIFRDTVLTTGWGILDVSAGYATKRQQTDEESMFAAGFVEGVLTAKHIEDHYANLFNNALFFPEPVDVNLENDLKAWFDKQRDWADDMGKKNPQDPMWRHSKYIFAQLDGLYAGYKYIRGIEPVLDMFALNFLNSIGDLLDLMKVLNPSRIPDWTKFTPEEAANYFNSHGHCSALIKLLPGYENMFMAHNSWFDYSSTNRIYKHYDFNIRDEATASRKVSFSSYPGLLESLDDFYHLSSGMVMLQTSNSIYNTSLYKLVTPQSLLAWQRIRIANMMAHNGKEWTEIISRYNSGTYNNQYMVIDLKLVTLGNPLPDNTLWVSEQIPGLVVAQDLTHILRAGYFPSYNVPFFEETFNKSGYPLIVQYFGNDYSYQLAPRAKIFRRDQASVKDMDTMKAIIRSNDYKHDPYSGGNPGNAICSRGDLVSGTDYSTMGCYDTKVSDFEMAKNFQADIINGPTLGTGLPPFSWTGKFACYPHAGLPETYKFPFIRTQPSIINN